MAIRVACVVLGLFGCGEVAKGGQLPDAGEQGEPDSAVPVACTIDEDCAGASANPRGCNVDRCGDDDTCAITERHDGLDFQVAPVFSSEARVSNGAGTPIDVIWDGTNFVVVYAGQTGYSMKRVSADGVVLDTTPALLDSRFGDIAFVNGKFVVATVEPANGTYPSQHFALHEVNSAGAVVTPKAVAMTDSGSNCPAGGSSDLHGPQLASTGSTFMLTGHVQCGFLVRGLFSSGVAGINWDVTLYRPRHERISAGPAGFSIITEENRIGMGANEPWVQTFSSTGAVASAYGNKDPYDNNGGPCCVLSVDTVSGKNGHLISYTRNENYSVTFEALDQGGNTLGTPFSLRGSYPNYAELAMAFDGANYLVVPTNASTSLPGYRISQQGVQLDATPIALTPDDAAIETKPVIASDGAGLNAIAYVKSTDNAVYIRTFATCPGGL